MSSLLKRYPSWPTYLVVGLVLVVLVAFGFKLAPTSLKNSLKTMIPEPVTQLNENEDVVRYIAYSPNIYNQFASRRRVLFFEASWCSTCKDADQNLSVNTDKIPSDVTVFKVDFDAATDLKQKYGVTNQHTFVQVDSQGNAIKVWNGGEISELLAELR